MFAWDNWFVNPTLLSSVFGIATKLRWMHVCGVGVDRWWRIHRDHFGSHLVVENPATEEMIAEVPDKEG
jgi:hypothetical protein